MFLPLGPLLNPALQRLDLSVCQLPPGIDRRHTESFILCADAAVELAARRVAGYNRATAVAEIRPCALFEIESQLRLAIRFVRAVTGKAGVGQDGADVSIELHLSRGRWSPAKLRALQAVSSPTHSQFKFETRMMSDDTLAAMSDEVSQAEV